MDSAKPAERTMALPANAERVGLIPGDILPIPDSANPQIWEGRVVFPVMDWIVELDGKEMRCLGQHRGL